MIPETKPPDQRPSWPWRCPDCGLSLDVDAEGAAFAAAMPCPRPCGGCGRRFQRLEGLADLRPLASRDLLLRFAAEYAAVRQAEGRGTISLADLRALPWPGPLTPMAWEWLIRSASFETFQDGVLRPIQAQRAVPRVLDLGAGVGWLSHRLAWEGCHALALDVCADPQVGLGAATGFLRADGRVDGASGVAPGTMTLTLADFNHVPLADASVDLVVFNASLHYGADLAGALAEAGRLLAPAGRIAVIDSPFYEDASAGRSMAAAQRATFRERTGKASNAQGGVAFLTRADLAQAGNAAGLRWRYLEPRRGWRWTLRRSWRRLRLGRESAAFPVVVAERV